MLSAYFHFNTLEDTALPISFSTLHPHSVLPPNMHQCLTHCWHMFIRPLVFSVSSLCLVAVCGSIDPISTWGSLKFHLILNLKANKEGKRKQDNRTESWWWISKVLIAPCISSCCPCVHHLTRQASLSRSSIKLRAKHVCLLC